MARRRTGSIPSALKGVTADRAARLYRLLKLLSASPQTRAALIKRLRVDVRGFYRDLGLLRAAGVDVPLENGRYALPGKFEEAVAFLPYPDPYLTLAEARQLAKGRSAAHRKLQQQIARIVK